MLSITTFVSLLFVLTLLQQPTTIDACVFGFKCWDDVVDAATDTFSSFTDLVPALDGIFHNLQAIKDGVDIIPAHISHSAWSNHIKNEVETAGTRVLDIHNYVNDIPGDVAHQINNILTPYVNQIPSIVSQVNNIPSLTSGITNKIDNISPNINQIPSILSQVNNIPSLASGITNKIENIPHINQIPSITSDVGSTLDYVEMIKTLTETWTTNPINLESMNDPQVEELADMLSSCMLSLLDLGDLSQAINDIIGIDVSEVQDFVNSVPDPSDIIFRVMAKLLLPKKSLVVFLCDEGVRIIIELANKMLNGEFGPSNGVQYRRRMQTVTSTPPDNHCDNVAPDEFCESEGSSYTYSNADNKYYIGTVNSLGEKHSLHPLVPDPYDNSDTNEYQKYKKIGLIIYIINELSGHICDIIENILGQELLKNVFPAITCNAFKQALGYAGKLVDIAKGGADLHDGDINNVRLKAVFRDRITIIHNQFALKNMMIKLQDSINTLHSEVQLKPTSPPTSPPSSAPTENTNNPTAPPTKSPSGDPTKLPTKSPTKSPIKSPTTYPTKSPIKSPTTDPTVSPTASPTYAVMSAHCDDVSTFYISSDNGNTFEQYSSPTMIWSVLTQVSVNNPTVNTVIKIECQNGGGPGGFISTVDFMGNKYSTTNPINKCEGHFELVSSSVNQLEYFSRTSEPWNLDSNSPQIADDAYWIWNGDETVNTMIFEFNFRDILSQECNFKGRACSLVGYGPISTVNVGTDYFENVWQGLDDDRMLMGDGKYYDNYIVIHPLNDVETYVEWDLAGVYTVFQAVLGPAHSSTCAGQNVDMRFILSIDGNVKYTSSILSYAAGTSYEVVSIDISGGNVLRIETDEVGGNFCDHAIVANPMLFCTTFEYIGCYQDTGDRALRYGPQDYGYDHMTCSEACRDYEYFALEDSGWCSCENDLEHAQKYGAITSCPPSHMGAAYANDLFGQNHDGSTPSTPAKQSKITKMVSDKLNDIYKETGYNHHNDEGEEMIVIKINSKDLYILLMVHIGFVIGFIIMAVTLTVKCYYGSNTRFHKYKVVTFDDIETESGMDDNKD